MWPPIQWRSHSTTITIWATQYPHKVNNVLKAATSAAMNNTIRSRMILSNSLKTALFCNHEQYKANLHTHHTHTYTTTTTVPMFNKKAGSIEFMWRQTIKQWFSAGTFSSDSNLGATSRKNERKRMKLIVRNSRRSARLSLFCYRFCYCRQVYEQLVCRAHLIPIGWL